MAQALTGAILAAGRGERLRPTSGDLPKPLIEINGVPLLVRQIHAVRKAGASPIHVVVNSETYRVICERELGQHLNAEILVRDTPNSMESLLAIGEKVLPGKLLVLMVDAVMLTPELVRFVTNATEILSRRELRLDGALAVVKWRGDVNPVFAQIADDGAISALGGRQSLMVTAGVYLFSTDIFAHTAEARRRGFDAMRRFLAMLLEKSMRLAAVRLEQAIDVDNAADLRAARELLALEAC